VKGHLQATNGNHSGWGNEIVLDLMEIFEKTRQHRLSPNSAYPTLSLRIASTIRELASGDTILKDTEWSELASISKT